MGRRVKDICDWAFYLLVTSLRELMSSALHLADTHLRNFYFGIIVGEFKFISKVNHLERASSALLIFTVPSCIPKYTAIGF